MNQQHLQQILNAVYQGAAKECEGRERKGSLQGNGHHMAQHVQENVKADLEQRLRGLVLIPAAALRVLLAEAQATCVYCGTGSLRNDVQASAVLEALRALEGEPKP